MVEQKKVPAVFYRTARGMEPVRVWLKSLDVDDRRNIGRDIAAAEFGWPIGMPVCRVLGNGLYEIRSFISQQRIARVIFCILGRHIVLLHGFIKKTQKTPKAELDLALKRKREVAP
jgi:phage-related protein